VFTLRFPFRVFKPDEIAVSDARCDLGGGLSIRLDATDRDETYALVVEGFSTRTAAEGHIALLARGGAWLMLHRHCAIEAGTGLQNVTYFPEPRSFDSWMGGGSTGNRSEDDVRNGTYSEGAPVVYPTAERLIRATGHAPTITLTDPGAIVLEELGRCLRGVERHVVDRRLDIACDFSTWRTSRIKRPRGGSCFW
jgi:hypothetical protein